MKPTVDRDNILVGQDAVDVMVDTWQDMSLGKVDVEFSDPYLVVTRKGGDYTAFLSLVSGGAVTITSGNDAVPRHIPEDLRVGDSVSDDQYALIERAFEGQSGGVFPVPDEGVFSVSFREDGDYKALHIGLTDDRLEVVED